LSVLSGVELVDIDVALGSASEQVATVGESDFSAALDGDCVERLKALLEHIHHSDSIGETDNQVEARWMEGNTVGFVWVLLTDLKSWRVGVVPDSHRLVGGAGGDEVLLDADVHALNCS